MGSVLGRLNVQHSHFRGYAVATAYVISTGVEGRNLMSGKFCKCHEDTGLQFSIFGDEKEALLWTNSYLIKE